MQPYPLKFHPLLKPRIWGGRALESLGKRLPPGQMIGESWELADLPESIPQGRSVIANGALAGATLHEAIERHHDQIMGDAKPARLGDGSFPLLLKYLDARENLSVQVHPDAQYVTRYPEAHLKSEAWVVIQARPGAIIYRGLNSKLTAGDFVAHVENGTIVRDLLQVPAKPGDCVYLPSGTCHALGAGIVVAEVQTPSDTTFRVFDWGRPAGAGRELHLQQAVQCISFGQPVADPRPHDPVESRGLRNTVLLSAEHFRIERMDALQPAETEIVLSGLPEAWMIVRGRGRIEMPGRSAEMVDLTAGTTVMLPAALEGATARFDAGMWLLRVGLPGPLKGLIA